MGEWRFMTAGESHGPGLVGIIEGAPAGVPLSRDLIDEDLGRRQKGYGRGGRMLIERDQAEIWGGVRHGVTLGSPIALTVRNRDYENWRESMSPDIGAPDRVVTRPRPGHADLVGGIKYGHRDLRNVLERASARETTMRVALGAVARAFLRALDIEVYGHVTSLGGIRASSGPYTMEQIRQAEDSPVRVVDSAAAANMMERIDEAKRSGDTMGGTFEIVAFGVPVGLGSYVTWQSRLGALLARALMSIPAMKGVEIGSGFQQADEPGSLVHDPIWWESGEGFSRRSNRAGGLEGGMSTGMPLTVRVAMKPLSTLMSPLGSFDIENKEPFLAVVERSDVTAVPPAVVVGEAMVMHVLADSLLQKFGGDSLAEIRERVVQWRRSALDY